MSRRGGTAGRAEQASLANAETVILNVIKSRKDQGIWTIELKKEAGVTTIPDSIVTKALKSLTTKNLIKEVVNFQNKRKKTYMAVEFQPSKDISGGDWYTDGKLDMNLIAGLREAFVKLIHKQTVATAETVHSVITSARLVSFAITVQQVKELLNAMVMDDEIIEVKSTGLKEYHRYAVGEVCYRLPVVGTGASKGAKLGAFASIPCGACPRISVCTPDGAISPSTCVYYSKWLDTEF